MGTGIKGGILFRKREALIVRAGAEGNAARCPLFSFPKKEEPCPHLPWGRETKGVFSFAKENTPFETPRERSDRQPRSRRSAAPPEWKHLRGGLASLAAIGSAIRLDLLLLPAAALPISQKHSLIPVYRWCQSRRRAQQSRRCAGSPPPSKRHSRATECARLIPVTTRRRLVAKPRTPHLIPQAAQLFKIETANVRGQGARPLAFLWGFQRGYSLRKENTPFVSGSSAKSCTDSCSAVGAAPPIPRKGYPSPLRRGRAKAPLSR